MADHLEIIGRIRADIADTIARFNARDVRGYMAKHAEDIQFAIPMLGGQHDAGGEWGRGRTAFADYVHLGFDMQGRLELVDLVAAGSSVGVLLVDSNGLRTETCLEFGPHGLVTRLFAFPLPGRRRQILGRGAGRAAG